MSSIIRGDDNFDSVAASHGRVLRTAGTVTTTSTSLVSFTGASITLTTGANPVAYGVAMVSANNTAGQNAEYNVSIDGTRQLGTTGLAFQQPASSGSYWLNHSFSGMTSALTAGSHTILLEWSVSAGTGQAVASSDTSQLFYAHEVK
tara:strand:+ start:85 stop:525 length:441 start_codon:yes stop_codon:yes gene_type:complete